MMVASAGESFFRASQFRIRTVTSTSKLAGLGRGRVGWWVMKLTIRDLLWLTLVVAIFLTWLRSDRQRAAELQAERAQFEMWRAQFQSQTAEILDNYRRTAMNPGAYQDWLKKTEAERLQSRQVLAKQLGLADENP